MVVHSGNETRSAKNSLGPVGWEKFSLRRKHLNRLRDDSAKVVFIAEKNIAFEF